MLTIVPKFQERYTFTIETSMCIEIIHDVYRYVRISVGTPVGGLNFERDRAKSHTCTAHSELSSGGFRLNLYILSRASEVGSPTNPPWAPGSNKTRGQGSFGPFTCGLKRKGPYI